MPSPPKKPKPRAARRAFGRIRKLPSGRSQASYLGPDLQLHNAPNTFDTKGRAEGWISEERKLINPAPNSLLFPDPATGKTMREWVYRRIFNKACAEIGRPDFRPGEQRHTGGTVAAQAGGTLPEVMERLRHKTPKAAMRYQKVAAGRAQTLASNISKLAKDADKMSTDQNNT